MATYKVQLAGINRHESWVFAFDVELDTPPVHMRQLTIGSGRDAIVATTAKVMPKYARIVSPEERNKQAMLQKLRSFREVSNIVEVNP